MLANFFDKTKPINSIVLTVVFFSFYIVFRFQQEPSTFIDFTTLESLIHLSFGAFFILLSGLVFIRNNISNDNLHNSLLMILFYGMFPETFEVNKTLGIAFLFLLIYKNVSHLKVSGKTQLLLFDSGVFTGISFLLFDWSILLLLFIYLVLLISKKINLRNIISPVLGFIIPSILYFTYCFITDQTLFFYNIFSFKYSLDTSIFNDFGIKIPFLVISTITVLAILVALPRIISVSNTYRFHYLTILLMLLIGGIIILMSPEKTGSEFLYVSIPISVILGKFIKTITQNKLKEGLLIGLTIFSIILLWHQP